MTDVNTYHLLKNKLPEHIVQSILFMQSHTYQYMDELERNIEMYYWVISDNDFNPHNYLSFHYRDYDEDIYDDNQCNGRCCGNKMCGFGYAECDVDNYRFYY